MDVLSALNDIYTEAEVDSLLSGKASSSHTHTLSDVTDAGTAAAKNVPATGDAAATECVLGSDSRMTDARTPTTHSHNDLYYTEAEVDSLLSGKAATSHSHNEFVPVGGLIFYDSGISGASYPGGNFAKCEGGSLPDLRGKFLLPDATPGGTSTTSTHSHTPSFSSVGCSPCAGGTPVAQVDITIDSVSHMPPYDKLITLARTA